MLCARWLHVFQVNDTDVVLDLGDLDATKADRGCLEWEVVGIEGG